MDFINSKHSNIKFTHEGESQQCLPFLDVKVKRENNKFVTSVFRKSTFTGLGTNYFSNTAIKYKISSLFTLLHRAFSICSSYSLFHEEVLFLRNYFTKNCFPTKLFNCSLKKFLNQKYQPKLLIHTVPKQKLYIQLPFIGVQTEKLTAELKALLCHYYPHIHSCFYFKNKFTIGSFFKRYEHPELLLRSRIVYKYTCHCCTQCYIGSSTLQMFRRVAQHKGVSFRTNRPLSKPDISSIREHCDSKNHAFRTDNFSILASCQINHNLKLLESLYIHNNKPVLNKNKVATPLHIVT